MIGKRILALVLSVLTIWPSIGLSAAAEDASFTPAAPPQGMYKVLQPIMDRRQLSYKDGYRTGVGVTYAQAVKEADPADLALYMNVYVDNAEGDDLDLFEEARYRQIDIQRHLDGEYYEVRWSFRDFSLKKGWNSLLLRFETDKNIPFTPADERMTVVNANKQNINWHESANFNFCATMVEEGMFSQYTIILDDVAIVDTSCPVNEATPTAPDYRLLQDLNDAMPAQELSYESGGYRAASAVFTPADTVKTASASTMAVYMNLYLENLDLPYHDDLLRDTAVTRRLILTDGEGHTVEWDGTAFAQLELQPGWNEVVWRLSDDAGLWDGIASVTAVNELSLKGPLQLSLQLSGLENTDHRYRIQIAGVALVDVSCRADGSAYYDTAYNVLTFSQAEQTYTAAGEVLTTGWVQADATTPDTGVDIQRHNIKGLRLRMELILQADDTLSDEVLKSGRIYLRSVDAAAGEAGGYWSISTLNLKQGSNQLSLSLADLQPGTPYPLDVTAVNRLQVELTGVKEYTGNVRMSLVNVEVVDIAGRREGRAAVATLSDGMQNDDLTIYNLNAAEWGADPTGVDDSTMAIQECLDTLRTNGGVVFLPAGFYRVGGNLSVPAGVTLRGEWQNPNDGGAGKGTILMAYAGAGEADAGAFISLKSSSCLRNISVWYPEQDPVTPVAYPPTIKGQSHTVVKNVTLYNTYTGFYNGSCSSMLIRNFYATALHQGIYGANAYDIPRIEQVSIDTRYWIESGLPGSPAGLQADQLNSYTRQNTTGLIGGRQDWGYWYDIEINNAKIGIMLFAGNDAVGKLTTRHVQYGIYTTNVNAPGLQITHSDISATVECVHYQVDGYQTLVASNTVFRDAPIGIHTVSKTSYGVSLNNCTFENWETYAVYMEGGHLTAANNTFVDEKPAFGLHQDVPQALLTGNRFADAEKAVICEDTTFLNRDDRYTATPVMPDYTFQVPETPLPQGTALFLVTDYGARAGGERDCTAAFQAALDEAGRAGGGTVYVPSGTYRLDGSLTVPSGVELRGSFDGAHYGNSTFNGTQLYIYGGKNDETAPPLITLDENAGVRGITVFYPEQGTLKEGEDSSDPEAWVHTYPTTIQMNAGCWVENMALVNAYRGIDAITNRCDGLLVRDTTGYTMKDTIQVGHGMQGGTLHNLHLNPSGWGQQGNYPNHPGDWFDSYATTQSTYLTLGDCTDLQIFSCFNIVIATQTHLIKDPYTGGCFNGITWGVAYDASRHGIICDGGIDSKLVMLASMGVFNQQGGGYNVWTKPGFTGEVNIFNADAWGSNSKIALVEGGSVNIVQYLSMSAYEALCREGGQFSMYNSVFTSRSGNTSGYLPDITYEDGSSGRVIGVLNCAERLNVNIEPGAEVEEVANGCRLQADARPMTFSGVAGTTADTDWVRWDGRADTFNLKNRHFHNLRLWLTVTAPSDTVLQIDLGSQQDEAMQTAGWRVELKAGENRLNLPFEDILNGAPPLNFEKVSHLRITGEGEVTLSAATIVDLTAFYPLKQDLYMTHLRNPADTTNCRTSDVQAYQTAWAAAQLVYMDEQADEVAIAGAADALLQAAERLVPIEKSALRELVAQAQELDETVYTPATLAAVTEALESAQKALQDGDADQATVDTAAAALQGALAGLEKLPTQLKGDVDGDGVVAASDALMVLQAATQKINLKPEEEQAALVSGGETVTSTDAMMILQYATGKITVW